MHIWYINHYAGGPGVGRLYRPLHLAQEWKRHGHDTTVLMADYHHLLEKDEVLPPRQAIEGVPYVALPSRRYKGNGLGRILNMARFCASLLKFGRNLPNDMQKPDVIIVSSPQPFIIFPGKFLARKFGAKLVFEVRDLWPLSLTEINGTSRWHPLVLLTAFTERFAYKNADLVASLLSGVETYMRERKLTYRKFIWVPNGIAQEKPNASPSLTPEALRLHQQIRDWKSEGNLVLFYPGGLGIPNGVLTLVDAFRELRKINPKSKWRAALVGEGGLRDELQRQLQDHGLDNIKLFSSVSKSAIHAIFPETDLGFIGSTGHPKVHCYGVSPNKALDYIKFNKPFLSFLGNVGESFRGYEKVIELQPGDNKATAETLQQLENGGLENLDVRQTAARQFEYQTIAQNYVSALH